MDQMFHGSNDHGVQDKGVINGGTRGYLLITTLNGHQGLTDGNHVVNVQIGYFIEVFVGWMSCGVARRYALRALRRGQGDDREAALFGLQCGVYGCGVDAVGIDYNDNVARLQGVRIQNPFDPAGSALYFGGTNRPEGQGDAGLQDGVHGNESPGPVKDLLAGNIGMPACAKDVEQAALARLADQAARFSDLARFGGLDAAQGIQDGLVVGF